jgi:hypothetical protein
MIPCDEIIRRICSNCWHGARNACCRDTRERGRKRRVRCDRS